MRITNWFFKKQNRKGSQTFTDSGSTFLKLFYSNIPDASWVLVFWDYKTAPFAAEKDIKSGSASLCGSPSRDSFWHNWRLKMFISSPLFLLRRNMLAFRDTVRKDARHIHFNNGLSYWVVRTLWSGLGCSNWYRSCQYFSTLKIPSRPFCRHRRKRKIPQALKV